MTRSWVEDEKFVPFLCDTDIPHLLAWEQLASGRLPYVDWCAPAARPCDEYPPGTMYLMKGITSVIGSGGDPYLRFSWLGTLALLASALWTTWSLERMGARTILFAASPVLLTAGHSTGTLLRSVSRRPQRFDSCDSGTSDAALSSGSEPS